MDNCSTGTVSQYMVKTQSGVTNLTTPPYRNMADSSEPTCSRKETHFMMWGTPQHCYLPHHTLTWKCTPAFDPEYVASHILWTGSTNLFGEGQSICAHTHTCVLPNIFLFFCKKKKKKAFYYLGKLTVTWPVQQNKRFVVFSFSTFSLLLEIEIVWEGNHLT